MGGIAAIIGTGDQKQVEEMMERMDHRGSDRYGGFSAPGVKLMQNYLKADIGPRYEDTSVPARDG